MLPADFHRLVTSLEALGRRDPAALRRRVLGWLWLGYAFLSGVMAALLAVMGPVVWGLYDWTEPGLALMYAMLFGFFVFVALWKFLRWWFKPEPPLTLPDVPRDRAPRLWARVDELRRALRARRVNAVHIVPEHNAAMVSEWRWRPYPHRTVHLVLGMPLLLALRPEQLDAVVAHELAHTFGPHASLRRRIGRAWRIWERLPKRPDSPPITGIRGWSDFVSWYVPRLNAHTLVAARIAEFESDAASARATSPLVAARTLAVIAVAERHVGEFWRGVWKGVERETAPPSTSWTDLPAWLREDRSSAERHEWLEKELLAEGLVEDSHPRLRSRIAALGVELPTDGSAAELLLGPLDRSAATHYLEGYADELLAQWEADWLKDAVGNWEDRRTELTTLRQRLDELIARDLSGDTLTVLETWHVAGAAIELGELDLAVSWLRRTLAADPEHAEAYFALGRTLLSRRDPAGVEYVERAMALDIEAVQSGASLLRHYHASQGDVAAAVDSDSRAQPRLEQRYETWNERQVLLRSDTFVAPALTAEDEARLIEAARHRRIGKLWVARKVATRSPGVELIAVVIEARNIFWTPQRKDLDELLALVHGALESPGRETLVVWWGAHEWLKKRIRQVGGVCVVGRTGTIGQRPLGFVGRHASKLWWPAGAMTIVGFWLAMTYAPLLAWDPYDVLGEETRRAWDYELYYTGDEVRVELAIRVDSAPRRLAPRYWAEVAYEQKQSWDADDDYGAIVAHDLRSGETWIGTGVELLSVVPRRFTDRVAELAQLTARPGAPADERVRDVFTVLRHRLREASLRPEIAPRPLRESGPARVAGDVDAAPTARRALERYRTWLARTDPDRSATILTDSSRRALDAVGWPSPLLWAHWRHLYVGELMALRERGDVAVAFASANPLVPPVFLRRGAAGWQVDRVAEAAEVEPITGGDFAWGLRRPDSDFTRAFRAEMKRVERVWRFRDGANGVFSSCGCRRSD